MLLTYGYGLDDRVRDAAIARMKRGPFQACQLVAFLEGQGVPAYAERDGRKLKFQPIACRVADKLIQKHRKAGDIKRDGREWFWASSPLR